jgi:hypothetical protein
MNQEGQAVREQINKVANERAAVAKAKREEETLEEAKKKEAEKAERKAEQAKREAANREKARLREAAPDGPRSMQKPPPPPAANNQQEGARGPSEGAADPKKTSVPNDTLTSSSHADPDHQPHQRPVPPAANNQQHDAPGGSGGPSEGAADPKKASAPNDTLTSSSHADPNHQPHQRPPPPAADNQQQRPPPPAANDSRYPDSGYQRSQTYHPSANNQQRQPPPPAANAQQQGTRGPSGGAPDPRRATLPVAVPTGPRNLDGPRGARPYHGFLRGADNPRTTGAVIDAPTGPADNQQ